MAAGPALAGDAPAGAEAASTSLNVEATRLPPVTVVAAPEETPLTGKSLLPGDVLEFLPEGNGSINEQLRVLPGVHLGEKSRTSLQGGEILPPHVSIAGGKVYQNNFTIDGFDNNSYADPTYEGSAGRWGLPGHPQGLFLDSDLVEEIRVYDHNVPAEFGAFTGGVIDARTRDPAGDFGGSLHYRTTNDRWTELHVDPEEEANFENSGEGSQQPKFEKHDVGVTFDLPLSGGRGLLTSYQRLQSAIPLRWFDSEKTERRLLENFFAKYVHPVPAVGTLRATLIHAPYDQEEFQEDSVDGEFLLAGENSSFMLSWEQPVRRGLLELSAGYRRSENERRGAPYLFEWIDRPREGGPGSLRSNQQGWESAVRFAVDAFHTGPLRHHVSLGIDRERIDAILEREKTFISGLRAKEDTQVACVPEDPECIDGEQYIWIRQVRPTGRVSVTVDFYGAFIEDRVQLGRLELRPGLRFSYDDFMRNRNIAPRLAASFDLLGDGRTLLIAGRNRYYGKTLLAYKLREMDRSYTQVRTSYADWPDSSGDPAYLYSELETPRTDETALGLDQILWGGLARLRYIKRDGEKEFARERDPVTKAYILNNKGSSRHYQYRFAWERWWRRQYLALNVTYQKTRASNEDYSETFDLGDLQEDVWYDGKAIDKWDLLRQDFNRPWLGNLVYSVRLPKGFAFTNITRYRGKYRALKNTGKDIVLADGSKLDIYDEVENSASWLFDWQLSWRKGLGGRRAVQLDLEVNNVFDRKIEIEEDGSGVYELGRQLWLGAKVEF